MAATARGCVRIVRALDAIWLAKALVGALAFCLWQASPVSTALGAVFALPLLAAAIAYIGRGLYVAATGHEPRGRPPAHLGRPSYDRRRDEVRQPARVVRGSAR